MTEKMESIFNFHFFTKSAFLNGASLELFWVRMSIEFSYEDREIWKRAFYK